MPAKLIPFGDYKPLRPELRNLWGSFAELRAIIRARRVPQSISRAACDDVDLESLRRATRDIGTPSDLDS
jgi:hypothetical protein